LLAWSCLLSDGTDERCGDRCQTTENEGHCNQLDPSLAVEGWAPSNSHETKEPNECNRGASNTQEHEYIIDERRHCLTTIYRDAMLIIRNS